MGAVLLSSAGLQQGDVATAREGARPNVLVVITDDQRVGLRTMPQTRALIRRKGTRYPNAYVSTPVCCPSRSSIFTGLYAHNHGVLTNGMVEKLDHDKTVQRYLHDAGYRTGIFGKYLNGFGTKAAPPYFDDWAVYGNSAGGDEYYDSLFNDNGKTRVIDGYSTDFITDRSVDFLARAEELRDRRPWLLFAAPNAPHAPFTPEPDYARSPVPPWSGNPAVAEEDKSDKPEYVQRASVTLESQQQVRKGQLRTLRSVDDMMAALVKTLRQRRELSNTLIIFMSDNGRLWGEHGLEKKSAPYQQAIHVPLMLRWKDRLVARSVDTRLVSNVDIAPTILSAAGIGPEPVHEMDGRSLLDPLWMRVRLLHEFWAPPGPGGRPGWASLHGPTYQYTEYYDAEGTVVFREYYDLVEDPWELNNLLGDGDPLNDPPEAELLSFQLAQDRTCSGPTCP